MSDSIPELVKIVIENLQDKKAEDLVVLNVSKLVNYTDYLIIATGNSSTHAQTLADSVEKILKTPEHSVKQENDPSYGTACKVHTQEFWAKFGDLLKIAEEKGYTKILKNKNS